MTLRTKILVYLSAIHLILGAIAVLVLIENRFWLLAVEGLFAVSMVVGFLLVRALFVPLRMIRTGAELIAERDFTTRFREVGQKEMDELIGIYNEMIDRLREERLKLEEQHVLLSKILSTSPAGVVILDLEGRIGTVNPAAADLLGLDPSASVGLRLEATGSPIAATLDSLAAGESRVVAAHGSRRLRCRRGEFLDRGFPRSFFLIEELTEELRASEKAAYQKLIRMMSHEVGNSVAAVISLLESCGNYSGQLAETDRKDFTRALDVAVSRMRHLNAFMNAFAEVVRLPPPDTRPCDLKRLLDDILLLLGPELDERRIAVRWEAAEPVASVPMDKNQMEQVLVNVLKNAVEAIGRDGSIALSLGRRDGATTLSIRDSGGGIPKEVAPFLFTPFFSTKRDGRGLGLTLVREILSQQGFAFGIDDRPGEGAEFWIRF